MHPRLCRHISAPRPYGYQRATCASMIGLNPIPKYTATIFYSIFGRLWPCKCANTRKSNPGSCPSTAQSDMQVIEYKRILDLLKNPYFYIASQRTFATLGVRGTTSGPPHPSQSEQHRSALFRVQALLCRSEISVRGTACMAPGSRRDSVFVVFADERHADDQGADASGLR